MKFVSAFAGTMSGSLGGMTASRNRGGQYLRQRVVPTNPDTSPQSLVRSYLAAAVDYWSNSLDAAERLAWTTYAANVPTTDTLGNVLVLTGQQMFIRHAVVRARIGAEFVDAAPTIYDRGQPITGILNANDAAVDTLGVLTAALDTGVTQMAPTDSAGDIVLQIGRPVSPAVNYYSGPYCFVAATPIPNAQSGEVLTATPVDEFPYGDLTIGERRPVRVSVCYDDGRLSTAFSRICTVVDDTP